MDRFSYGGFLKWWVSPTTIGFPTKNDHFGVFWGYHHLRKHPIYQATNHGCRHILVPRQWYSLKTCSLGGEDSEVVSALRETEGPIRSNRLFFWKSTYIAVFFWLAFVTLLHEWLVLSKEYV